MGETRYKAAIVGCGNVALGYDLSSGKDDVWTHGKAYAENNCTDLVAVTDTDRPKADAMAEKTGAVAYDSVPALLNSESIDILSICTPDDTHLDVIESCLDSNVRAIWCEKPLSMGEYDRAEDIVSLLNERSRLLLVNYIYRFEPLHQKINSGTADSEYGKPVKIVIRYTKGFMHSASHFVDLLLHWSGWLGDIDSWEILDNRDSGLKNDPDLDVCMRFKNGCSAYFLATDENNFRVSEVDIFSETHRIRIGDGGSMVEIYKREFSELINGWMLPSKSKQVRTDINRCMYWSLQNLVAALDGKEALISDGETALQTLRLCHSIINS